jgi:hypothetical protein
LYVQGKDLLDRQQMPFDRIMNYQQMIEEGLQIEDFTVTVE